eukprot:maker-scaffold481_size160081-snap-gene-0.15 protein:Tk12154 transcript:maker-scaffold481_size160081-snap-gene-0.15-mRNA-1 annotation:"zinc metalloproteinase"
MKIQLLNVVDGEVFHHAVVLIQGVVDTPSVEASCTVYVSQSCSEVGSLIATHPISLKCHTFKHLARLSPGTNEFVFQYLNKIARLSLICNLSPAIHTFKLFYVVCSDSDGRFQAPQNEPNDMRTAQAKIQLGAELIQCFLGDSLACRGFERKSIHFQLDDHERPEVEILRSDLTTEQARTLSGQELWEIHGKELLKRGHLRDGVIKCIAIMSATRYKNRGQTRCQTHAEILACTQGHAALGGGGLALFGSGCLYTWPVTLDQVQKRFLDPTPVDWRNFMDDSGYRGTIGGCFASSLGAIIHEVGHCLELEHTQDGIMARGFDDLDFFFSVLSETTSHNIAQTCTSLSRGLQLETKTRSDASPVSGRDLIDRYHLKLHQTRIKKLFGEAFWSGSGSIILDHHKWLNPKHDSQSSIQLADGRAESSEGPIRIVDIRDKDFFSVGFVEMSSASITMAALQEAHPNARQFLIMNSR